MVLGRGRGRWATRRMVEEMLLTSVDSLVSADRVDIAPILQKLLGFCSDWGGTQERDDLDGEGGRPRVSLGELLAAKGVLMEMQKVQQAGLEDESVYEETAGKSTKVPSECGRAG